MRGERSEGTIHARAVALAVKDAMSCGGANAADLGELWGALASGGISGPLVEAVSSGRRATLGDAWAVREVFAWLASGELLAMEIPLGCPPMPDAFRSENARRLQALPKPWVASIDPGWEGDGSLRWASPVRMRRSPLDGPEEWIEVAPGCVPLEVGSTQGSRTLVHLIEGVGIARWAYESEALIVFHAADRWRWAEARRGAVL